MASYSVQYIFSLVDQFSGRAGKMGQAAKKASTGIRAAGQALNVTERAARAAGAAAAFATGRFNAMARAIRNLRTIKHTLMTGGLAGGLGGGIGAFSIARLISQYASYEQSLISIKKVFTGTNEELDKMLSALPQLNKEIGLPREDIAKLMEEGIRAGVSEMKTAEDYVAFTKTAAKFMVAFGLSGDQAARSLAKMKSQLNLTMPELESVGDTMNTIAANFSTNETEMLEYMRRLGGLAKAIGGAQGIQDAMVIGAAQMAAGTPKEVAATGMRTLLARISSGHKDTLKTLQSLGLSPDKVQKGLSTDMLGTITSILEALAALPDEKQAGALAKLAGLKSFDAFARLLSNVELMKQVADIARGDYRLTMESEFNKRNASLQAILQKTSNVLLDLSDSLVAYWRPTIDAVLDGIQSISKNLEGNPWLAWAVGLYGLASVIGMILLPLGMLAFSLSALAPALGLLLLPLNLAKGFITGLAAALAPLGRAVQLATRFGGAMAGALVAFRALRSLALVGIAIELVLLGITEFDRIKEYLTTSKKFEIVFPDAPDWLKWIMRNGEWLFGGQETDRVAADAKKFMDNNSPQAGWMSQWQKVDQVVKSAPQVLPRMPSGAAVPMPDANPNRVPQAAAERVQIENSVKVQTDFAPATVNVTGRLEGLAGIAALVRGSGTLQANRGTASSEAGAVSSAPAP